MSICSVSGCESTHENCEEAFYPFPSNFDLCMQWVQTCGKADYFEDFAYGGTLPFIERTVCSKHFETTDFIDPNNKLLGLRDKVIPIGCFTGSDIVIKEEILDTGKTTRCIFFEGKNTMLVDLEGHFDEDSTEFEETHIKAEPHQNNNDFLNDHDYLSGKNSNEFIHPMLPLLVIAREKLIWKKKPVNSLSHNTFKSTWSQALEDEETRTADKTAMYKNSNKTEEERPNRNEEAGLIKLTNESEQERKDRLYKNAVRAALRRSLETEEQIRERRLKNALRAAYRRSVETPEQRAERRRKDLLRSAKRRREETELQSKIRKYNDAVRAAFRRRNETPEQRTQRKMIDVLRAARRRSKETPEKREARLKADRERAAKRRFFKKLNIFDQGMPEHQEIRYFNLKIMKKELDPAFTNTNRNETIPEDENREKAKLAEQKNIQCPIGKLQSESKLSQTMCTFKAPSFENKDVRTAKSVINSEIQNTSPGITDAKGIEEKDKNMHPAFNRYKRSEIVW